MCPFVNAANPRCASDLTLANLTHAFTRCAGQYRRCPIYLELTRRKANAAHDPTDIARLAS